MIETELPTLRRPRRELTPRRAPAPTPTAAPPPPISRTPARTSQARRDLRAMLADGVFFSVMVGIGETYLPAFVLAVGLGEVAAGLITSVPLLAGAILQLIAPWMVRRIGSHRKWVVLCATVQAASFIPLCIAAALGYISIPAVFLTAAVYWGFGMATGPAWNTWAETIVPRQLRPRYFARRTRFCQAGVLFGFVLGGLTLHFGRMTGYTLEAFIALFMIAGICRYVSSRCLASQSEPCPRADGHRDVRIFELFQRLRSGGSERLLIFLVTLQFGVYISGPFFNPYMLGQLQFSYTKYVLLVATSFAAKMAALVFLGNLAQRWGAQRLLWIGALGIAPLSAMWLVSHNLMFLVALQFFGGVTWAAYELAMMLLFFEAIRREERTSVLTIYNVANALAMVLGSLFGGLVMRLLGEHPQTYLVIFALSSLARFGSLGILPFLPKLRANVVPLSVRITAIRPSTGAIDPPILPSLPEETPPPPVALRPALASQPAKAS